MHRLLFSAMLSCALASPSLAGEAQDPRCAVYGKGFVYAADISSCIRISGFVQADVTSGKSGSALGGEAGVGLDVRRETELGSMRLVLQHGQTVD